MVYERKRKAKVTSNLTYTITIYVVEKSGGEAELSARKEFGLDMLNLR